MDLHEIFKSTNLKCVISIDDDWNYVNTAESIMFDILKMSSEEKLRLFKDLSEFNEDITKVLSDSICELERIGFSIIDKPKHRIFSYIEDPSSLEKIQKFTNSFAESIENITQRYGIGLQSKGVLSLMETLSAAEKANIPIRIYTDFVNDDKTHFEKSVEELTAEDGYVFCIIDDNMHSENRANEILSLISSNDIYKRKVSCVLVTSKDNTDKERHDKDIYVEFIKKQTATTKDSLEKFNTRLTTAYLKSLYRIMLANLQKTKKEVVDSVFDNLYNDINTAAHISSMARIEGVTNFDLINKWIYSQERMEIENKKINDIKNIIALSNVLNDLQQENTLLSPDTNNKLFINDVYDKTINALYKPIDVGDVFEINGSIFVLIGQECDLAIRGNGKRKTEVLEFVAAKVFDSPIEILKNEFSYEQAIIGNFPSYDGGTKYISIDCTKRYYGKPDMFDMCVFNDNGSATIHLSNPLSYDIKPFIHVGLNELYKQIQRHYSNLNAVKDKINDPELFTSFVSTVGLSNVNNEVIAYDSYALENDTISYPIRRICRLRMHAQLLHRMYLNYRGRQAEDAVCFSRHIEINYSLGEKTCKAKCFLSSKSNENNDDRLHRRPWVVEAKDINVYLESVHKSPIAEESLYIERKSQKFGNYTFKKEYDSTNNRLILTIE